MNGINTSSEKEWTGNGFVADTNPMLLRKMRSALMNASIMAFGGEYSAVECGTLLGYVYHMYGSP